MKQRYKILWVIAIVVLSTFFTMSLCSCGNLSHTHTFEEGFSGKDESGHWHKATCQHTDKISGFEAHIYNNGVCTVCGYEETSNNHTHTFEEGYSGKDDTNHWHVATCQHTDEKSDVAPHTFVEGVCSVCGYKEPHTHTFEEGYSGKDETNHWHIATCQHTDEKSGVAPHTFVDRVCTVCGRGENIDVTLNYNGATGGNTQEKITITYGSMVGTLPTPTKDGYTFVGWQLDGTTISNETVWTSKQETAVFEAVWIIAEYTVTFIADNTIVATQTFTIENKNITEPDVPAKTGYNGAWEDYTLTNSNIIVYAKYIAKRYTVVLNYNGATSGNTQENIAVTYGRVIGTLPTPIKTGYEFLGWQLDGNRVTAKTVWTSTIDMSTFEAKWQAITYTVTFVADGKTVKKQPYTVENKKFTEPDVPVKTGYNGVWEDYELTNRDVTVTAVYSAKQCIATLDYDGATGNNKQTEIYVTFGKRIGTLPTPMKNGYEFLGWFLDGEKVEYSTIWTTDGDTTIVAQWKIILVMSNNLQIQLNSDETSYIVLGIGNEKDADIIISGHNFGKPVIINDDAFKNCSSITSVTIGRGVTIIGNNAFKDCSNLINVDIVDSVTHIGDSAFDGCNNLSSISIPEGVTSIGSSAFSGCSSLSSIPIPKGVKSIGSSAFSGCSSLENITIPDSVMNIGERTFFGCSSLTNITIPDGVTRIGNHEFDGCTHLTSVTIGKGVTSIGDSAFYNCGRLKKVYWNATACTSAGSLDHLIFKGCQQLTNVVIGDNVTCIPDYAFYDCHNITDVTIGKSMASIGDYAFDGCNGLTDVHIKDIASWCGIRFNDSSSNPLMYTENLYLNNNLVTEIVIPDGVTSIGNYAFYNYNHLTSVTIPNSVTSIGNYAFYTCYNLTSVTTGNGITSIGDYTFFHCSKIVNITIPANVTSIGDYAFTNCFRLVEVFNKSSLNITVGSSDNGSVGDYAKNIYTQEGGSKLAINDNGFIIYDKNTLVDYIGNATELEIPDTITVLNNYALYERSNITSITIPDSVIDLGLSTFSGCSSLTSITIGNGVKSMGDYLFNNCSNLTSITIGKGLTSISSTVFEDCTNLKNVYISDIVAWCEIDFSMTYSNPLYIAQNLYLNDKLVTEIVLPEGVTNIKNSAFINFKSLVSITIPTGVTIIGEDAFSGCSYLTSITLPDSVTSIGESAFSGCSKLTSITIPKGVTSIGSSAFSGCSNLESINVAVGNSKYHSDGNCIIETKNKTLILGCKNSVIPTNGTVTSIGDYAFDGCNGLTNITISSGVLSIGDHAFKNCNNLTTITIDGVTRIGESAFENCRKLTSFTIPNSVTNLGKWAFDSCSNLTYVIIGSNVKIIGMSVFFGCSKLTSLYYYGTAEDWEKINIDSYNDNLKNATLYYYSRTVPPLNSDGTAYNGNYWCYKADNKTLMVWIKEN